MIIADTVTHCTSLTGIPVSECPWQLVCAPWASKCNHNYLYYCSYLPFISACWWVSRTTPVSFPFLLPSKNATYKPTYDHAINACDTRTTGVSFCTLLDQQVHVSGKKALLMRGQIRVIYGTFENQNDTGVVLKKFPLWFNPCVGALSYHPHTTCTLTEKPPPGYFIPKAMSPGMTVLL